MPRKFIPLTDWPKTINYYLHGDDDTNYDKGAKIGLQDEALNRFGYCCYELDFKLEVHEDGAAYITHISGIELKEKVLVS